MFTSEIEMEYGLVTDWGLLVGYAPNIMASMKKARAPKSSRRFYG